MGHLAVVLDITSRLPSFEKQGSWPILQWLPTTVASGDAQGTTATTLLTSEHSIHLSVYHLSIYIFIYHLSAIIYSYLSIYMSIIYHYLYLAIHLSSITFPFFTTVNKGTHMPCGSSCVSGALCGISRSTSRHLHSASTEAGGEGS